MLRIIASLSTPVNLTAHGTHTCGPNGDFTSTSHQPKHAQAGRAVRQITFTESQGFCSFVILRPLAHDAKLVRSQNKMTDYRIHSLRCHACAPVQHLSCSSPRRGGPEFIHGNHHWLKYHRRLSTRVLIQLIQPTGRLNASSTKNQSRTAWPWTWVILGGV